MGNQWALFFYRIRNSSYSIKAFCGTRLVSSKKNTFCYIIIFPIDILGKMLYNYL